MKTHTLSRSAAVLAALLLAGAAHAAAPSARKGEGTPLRSARPPRVVGVPAQPANPMDVLMQMSRLESDLEGLREYVAALRADSSLDASERAAGLVRAQGRIDHALRRLERYEAALASVPAGTPVVPNMAAIPSDSLARVVAVYMEQLFRASGNLQGLPELIYRPEAVPVVRWSQHDQAPLPPIVTRDFNATVTLPAGTELMALTHRFGDVVLVSGQDGQVEVEGKVSVMGNLSNAEARELADSVRLITEVGTRSAMELRLPALRTGQSVGIRVDITVKVPRSLPMQVRNSYGDVAVSGLAGRLDCSVGFGNLIAEDLSGGCHLGVRNATLKGNRLSGPIGAETQMGTVILEQLGGELSLNANNCDVHVRDARAGGALQATSGSLELRDAGAAIQVSGQNAPISIEGVRGKLTLNTQYCAVQVAQVSGPLSAQCVSGSLVTSFIQQAQDLQTRFCQVQITNPGGDVLAHGESAPMLIRLPEGSGPRRYDATVRNGNVTLEVPEHCSASIHAATNSGSIVSDLPLSRQDTGDWQRGQTMLGQGESQVSLGGLGASVRIARLGR